MTNEEVKQQWDVRVEQERVERSPFTPSSKNQVLGNIIWVDPRHKRAVMKLNSGTLQPSRTLVSRDRAQSPTALLQPSKNRKGDTLGLVIAYGMPAKGDEVLLRDAAELPQNWGTNASPQPTTIGTFPFIIPEDKEALTDHTQFIQPTNTTQEKAESAQ